MTRTDQIIAAYRGAIEPREIADRLGCSINRVTSVISTHKRRTGEVIEPSHRRPNAPAVQHEGHAWTLSAHGKRMAFYKRAVAGAHQARMASA